jgi:CrcB protein
MSGWLIVGLGGAFGATSRHAVDLGMRKWFPTGPSVGILVANLSGSLLLGIMVGLSMTRYIDRDLQLALTVGFCGAFTTFSTFAAELAGLVNDRSSRLLVQWTVAMVIGGGVAAAVGIAIGRSW